MKLSSIFFATLASLAVASPECANKDFDDDPLDISPTTYRRALADHIKRDIAGVDLYIHVLVAKKPTEDFGPSINKQLQFTNGIFNKWGFNFNLKLTTYVIHPGWAKGFDFDNKNKFKTLHRGDYQTLNLYMIEDQDGGPNGRCWMPVSGTGPLSQEILDQDGCAITLALGRSPNATTLAHEIGHWLGLHHTFQGGCGGTGDGCDDTPPQKDPSWARMTKPGDLKSCTAPKETCGVGKGFENTNNLMDYGSCRVGFTPCQGGRMAHSWNVLRKGRKLAPGVTAKW